MEETLKSPNIFATTGFDRAAHLRDEAEWVREKLCATETRLVPVWRGKSFVTHADVPEAVFLSGSHGPHMLTNDTHIVFLGLGENAAYFALDWSWLHDPDEVDGLSELGRFVDLQDVGSLLKHHEAALLAYARGMCFWHRRHRYCGRCGMKTAPRQAGHLRVCVNTKCGLQLFPRTDPAIIVLVTHEDSCLLGRQKRWPARVYSTLAGFVEPGESLEDAVVRELREEVGLEVADISYHSSQPWPFPSSLMLGFTAEATSRDIRLDPEELEDAIWVSREDLRHRDKRTGIRLPRRYSIARRLIDEWTDNLHGMIL